MGLHKLPILKIILQNVDDSGNGYLYLRAKIPGKKSGSPYVLKSLNHKVPVANWDAENEIVKRGYSQAARINNLIQSDKKKLQETFDKDYETGTLFTEAHIRHRMYPPASNKDFITYFEEYLKLIKTQWSEGYYRSFENGLSTFTAFAGESLPFHAITAQFLEKYLMYLTDKTHPTTGKKMLSKNTIYLRMRHLGEVIDKAIDAKLIDSDQIKGFKFPSYKAPVKPYLTLEQTEAIWNKIESGMFDINPVVRNVACYFLVECYSGVRFSDWQRFTIETLVHGENFKVGAAQKNKEPIYLPLTEFTRLKKVVDFIIANNIKFTHPEPVTNKALKTIALACGIPVHITTHTGRRSAATLLGEMGWTTRDVADVLGVSEETAKTYIKRTKQGVKNASKKHGGL